MRFASLVAALGLAAAGVCLPAAADDGPNHPNTGQCRRMTRQIARFEGDARMARDRDNELWEKASEDQVLRLETRRARLCPEYAKSDNAAKQFALFLAEAAKTAAQAAAAYFVPVP
jgi:hypothetical protein